MSSNSKKHPTRVQVRFTIIDGEFEYCDGYILDVAEGSSPEEQVLRDIAVQHACEPEDEESIYTDLKSEGRVLIGCREITDVRIHTITPVTIIVRGGCIQNIRNIPPGVTIRVQDYDLEGLTVQEREEQTEPDATGEPCIVSLWEAT